MKKPQICLDYDAYDLLKLYCVRERRNLCHVASQILRAFLETEHKQIESEGNMIIEGEGEKPETIVAVLHEDQEEEEPRRSVKTIEIVRKGNRFIVKKERG